MYFIMKIIFSILFFVFMSSLICVGEEPAYGEFPEPAQVQFMKDGRNMKLIKDFYYIDKDGVFWIAPKGTVIDGASIPRFAWTIIGSPYAGLYRDAAIIHDFACDDQSRDWEEVHKAFYYGMRRNGVNKFKAGIMYACVYTFGPRWKREPKEFIAEVHPLVYFIHSKVAFELGFHHFPLCSNVFNFAQHDYLSKMQMLVEIEFPEKDFRYYSLKTKRMLDSVEQQAKDKLKKTSFKSFY